MSATPLNNGSFQASHNNHQRLPIVARLLAEGSVLLVVMASGWWGMTTLSSDSLQQMRDPIYVAGCPLADTTLENGSAGGGCSKEGVSHPITTRQPGAGLSEHAHGAERHRGTKPLPEFRRIHLPRTWMNKEKACHLGAGPGCVWFCYLLAVGAQAGVISSSGVLVSLIVPEPSAPVT